MKTFISCAVFIFSRILCLASAQEFEIVEAVVGHTAELPCNVTAETEDDKLSILAWYKDRSRTAFYSSRDLREETPESAPIPGRYRLVQSEEEGLDKLQITSVQPSDAGDYHCLADFASSPTQKTFTTLHVIEPPQRLWVVHENGTRVTTAAAGSNVNQNVGPYYVGDTVHLFCVAFGGKPLANLTWLVEGRELKNTWTRLSEQRVRSDLTHGPLRREDRGRVLTCVADNNQHSPPISIDVIIDMHLGPELVSVRDTEGGGGSRTEGGVFHLQCRVLGAVPPPDVLWRLGDTAMSAQHANVTIEPTQQLVTSSVELPATPELDEMLVTCCAPANLRTPQYVCAQPLPLAVLYKPIVIITIEEGLLVNNTLPVVKGSNVTLNCTYQANPPVDTQIWFHEDYAISDEETHLHPILELVNVTEKDAGEYSCWANNREGFSDSEPISIDVTYPAYCEIPEIDEYGIGDNDPINITCRVKGNPAASEYRWVIVNDEVTSGTFRSDLPHEDMITNDDTLEYRRPHGIVLSTILCWGLNGLTEPTLPTPCVFRVTDETVPRPPTECAAVKAASGDITVICQKGHDGGLPQKFKFIVMSLEPTKELVGIVNLAPKFIIEEPKAENYKFVITATNEKGDSNSVEIDRESVIDETANEEESVVAVENITTLALSLCGGVLFVALAACGLVLCAHERAGRAPRPQHTTLQAYQTDESNCETCHDSDDEGSDLNVRRTESFKKAISRYPSRNFDVRRTNSFHSARYMHDVPEPESINKCTDMLKHSCRVHSMHNLNRRREMEAMCDHLVMQLPREPNCHVPKPMDTFYTLPRKLKNKNKVSDEVSVITQNSDGFSLPPPPDEFGTYRAATRIKDIPTKAAPTYTTIRKKAEREPNYNDVIISPMNTVGLPTSGAHSSLYSYPDDDHHQKNILTTFKSDV